MKARLISIEPECTATRHADPSTRHRRLAQVSVIL
jgi:hypothetical protein